MSAKFVIKCTTRITYSSTSAVLTQKQLVIFALLQYSFATVNIVNVIRKGKHATMRPLTAVNTATR